MFEIPEDIKVLDDAALSAALDAAFAEGRTYAALDPGALSAEQIGRLVALADFVKSGESLRTERREYAAQVDAARSAFADKPDTQAADLTPAPDEEGEEDKPRAAEVEVAEQPAPPDSEEVPLPKDTKPAQTKPEDSVPEDSNIPKQDENDDPEADVPNKQTSAAERAAGSPPVDTAAVRRGPALVAAAGLANFASNHNFAGLDDLGVAITDQLSTYPQSFEGRDAHMRGHVAKIALPHEFSQENFRNDEELLAAAANEHRLAGGSVVAAGGWDAPSETLYDLCGGEVVTGLVSLPEVRITRGGLRYTKGPTLADVMASGTGFWNMTEAQVEALTAKTALRPTEPTFVEQRLDVIGTWVQAGLLTRVGYPELVRRYIELAVKAHAYKRNAKILAALEANIGAAVTRADGFGNAMDLFHAIELIIVGERNRLKLPQNTTVEVLLPDWVRAVIRADWLNRSSTNDLTLADAAITAAFRARGANVQFLYAWQELGYTSGLPTGYPDTVTAIIYQAGTYVVGTSPVINLDTIYDSVLLEENHYSALFMEEGILVANPCGAGQRVTLSFRANGRTGAHDITNNLYNAGV